MQPATAGLTTVLEHATASDPLDLTWLFEFYPYDVTPGADGFDPADAVQRFASIEITWLGYAYRRAVLSASDIRKAKGDQANRCTLRLSNADENRYVATWVTQNQVEGMRLVVRLISRSASTTLAASNIRFSGRCDKPEGFDVIQGSISATEDVGGDAVEFPPRDYLPDDPEGRSPADPLNEGFPLIVLRGSFTHQRLEPDKSYSRRDPRRYFATLPYSSYDDTPLGEPIPMILGRSQLRMGRGVFVDEGFVTRCIDFACMGPIAGFLNFRMEPPPSGPIYFTQPESVTYHLGEAGGVGTQTHDPLWPNHPYFSYTAYIGYLFRTIFPGAATTVDAGQPTIAVVLGLTVALPDSSGIFNTTGWTDNGAYHTRHLLTHSRFFNIDPAFIEESACYLTGQYNDAPLVDESNSGQILIPDPDLSAAGVDFHRFRATGLINTYRARYNLGLESTRPEAREVDDFEGFDPDNPPTIAVDVRRLIKRFTTNVLLRKRVKGRDFLFKTLLPSFRGYLVWNYRGRIDIRSERPADFAHLRGAVSAGATTIPVEDATPWTAAGGLWGQAWLGPPAPQTTSEVRKVTAAAYTGDANSITLTAAKTGSLTVSASGVTLAGGNSSTRASGTVTIGGSPAIGDTVTVTIASIPVTYTAEADETTATVAYMVAQHITANTQLRRFVSASASGSVVTVLSKWGVLTLSSPLVNSHSGPVSNPTTAPAGLSASGAGSSLEAGTYRVAYANRNAQGSTYPSPYSSITVTAGQQINIPALAFPAGVTSRDWFISKAANDPEMVLHTNTASASAFAITSKPDSTAAPPPEYNTTGEELIRVALSFASNNQTAAILAQANLTRGNIFADTYKWPGGREQTTYTEVQGNYVSAKDDFAPSKVIVSDPDLKARLGKKSPKELDLTAVDGFHQAQRLVYFDFAKYIDRHWFNSLKSNGLALLLEEGDVICASDDSGGHVNVLTQVEEFTIHLADFTVSINRARLYSSQMFRELVPKTRPLLPSVLRWTATLDTVAQLIDLPVWDEADRGRALVRLAARPEDGLGDWGGFLVFVDAGDGRGYVQIATHDVQATMGELLTALPTASPYTFDNTSTVRVRVDGQKTLTSYTEEEVLKGANLARAGGVLFRFKTATLISSTDTTKTYGLTGLLIGLHGTENRTATTGDAFTLFDGSELEIDWPLEWLNKEVSVKVATVNRDLADVTAQAFTWTGASLKHPAPQLVKGYRNVSGDILSDWVATVLGAGGIRTGLRNPLGDEEERYAFYVMSDDGLTAHYRWEVTPGLSYAPAFWQYVYRPWPTACEVFADGSVDIKSITVLYETGGQTYEGGAVRSAQVFSGEVMLVFKVATNNTPFIGFQLMGKDARRDPLQFYMAVGSLGDVVVEGVTLAGVTGTTGDEFTIWKTKDGQIRYYKGSGVTEQSIPIYTSTVTPEASPYVAVARHEFQGFVDNVRILRREPEAMITAEMQTAKFGALKSSLRVRVNRISSLVGEGHSADVWV